MGSYHVVPLLADHAKGEQCLIYIISKGNKTILYDHDSGWFPEESWEVLKNFKLNLAILVYKWCFSANQISHGHRRRRKNKKQN